MFWNHCCLSPRKENSVQTRAHGCPTTPLAQVEGELTDFPPAPALRWEVAPSEENRDSAS